jgi:transcriptional regulator with XRE-family HTH domain
MPKSTPPTWQIELGKQIKKARKDQKYPQQKLASLLGVDPETVRSYEAGTRPPPLPKLRVIVQELRATFNVEGILISTSTLPPVQLEKVSAQIPFSFQCAYAGMDVRIAASTKGFELRGYAPSQADDTDDKESDAQSTA